MRGISRRRSRHDGQMGALPGLIKLLLAAFGPANPLIVLAAFMVLRLQQSRSALHDLRAIVFREERQTLFGEAFPPLLPPPRNL